MFYCPVGVWVIEQRAIILSATVRSPIVFFLNTESINAKFAQLEILIDLGGGDQGLYFDVICLQESWLKSGHKQFNISGYNLINQYKCCSEHGGLMIYVISDLKTRNLKQITDSDIWEGIFVQVDGERLEKTFVIGNIYRPPRDNNNRENIETFSREIEPILFEMNNTCKDVVMAGDYNINLLKIQEVPHFLNFFEFMANHSFYPKITLPTRLAKYSSSLIDNYYCKMSQNLLISECGILNTQQWLSYVSVINCGCIWHQLYSGNITFTVVVLKFTDIMPKYFHLYR